MRLAAQAPGVEMARGIRGTLFTLVVLGLLTHVATCTPISSCPCVCHADPVCDGVVNVLDVVSAIGVAFQGEPAVIDPECAYERTDVTCSGYTSVLDVVTFVNVAFKSAEPSVSFCDPCPSAVYALVNGVLIDGTGALPVSPARVVIVDEHIAQAGPDDAVVIPPGATVIDLDGATILPGFINAHVHNGFNDNNLRGWAAAGVTTVRDLGANPNLPLESMRQSLNASNTRARLVYAGPMVTVPGGYPTIPWGAASALPVTSKTDAVETVHDLVDMGSDLIKIALERGDNFGLVIPTLPPDQAAAICSTAQARGTVVSAHTLVARDLDLALNAGVHDIAHMAVTAVSLEQVERMVANDVHWVPTLELWDRVGYNFPAMARANLSLFVQGGGQVALGTDYDGYNSPFELGMPFLEMTRMSDAGMTPMQIIVAATRNAAHVCNMGPALGTLEPGKIADVLIVNRDPLENLILALADVRMVIHNGEIIVDQVPAAE